MKSEDVIKRAEKARKEAYEAEKFNRQGMVDDLRFAALDQWPEDVKKDREGRTMLTLDRTNQAIRSVIGEMQESQPSIKVLPVDDNADPDTAEVFNGLIRHIETSSNATNIYIGAARYQVKCGYGVWRIKNEFTSHDSFEQDLYVRPTKNPLNWWFDPKAEQLTKHDGRWVIGLGLVHKDEIKSEFPEVEGIDFDQMFEGEGFGDWVEGTDYVVVAEYYEKVDAKKSICLLSNGATVDKDKLDDATYQMMQMNGVEIVREREADSYEIHYHKVTGVTTFDHQVLPYKLFPVIPVFGEVENIEGEEFVRGLIRPAKDPQRMYNYMNSAAVEGLALQPKAPFIGTAKMFSKFKGLWNRANKDNLPFLPYTPDSNAPGDKPERSQPPVSSSGYLQHAQIATDDIRSAMGIHEPSLGEQSNETSGRAILARQQGSQLGTSLYAHNLQTAIEHTGRVLVEMIPHFFDTMRTVRILGEDGQEDQATINQPVMTPQGPMIRNDLTRGKYDVRISTGPSYKTRRTEAVNTLMELVRVFPQLSQLAGDLIAKNLDIPHADELEERLRKTLPPGLIDDPELQAQQQQQAQQQAQIQQVQMQRQMAEIKEILADVAEKQSQAGLNKAKTASELQEAENSTTKMVADLIANAQQQESVR